MPDITTKRTNCARRPSLSPRGRTSAFPSGRVRRRCKLLGEHVHFGTQFEDFIGRCLASDVVGSVVDALSDRERDVFQQLQTARTLHEIAHELDVSINTVKTHQRAIYRKLGVSSRREAVRTTV